MGHRTFDFETLSFSFLLVLAIAGTTGTAQLRTLLSVYRTNNVLGDTRWRPKKQRWRSEEDRYIGRYDTYLALGGR